MDETRALKPNIDTVDTARGSESITRHRTSETSPLRHVPVRVAIFSAVLVPVVLIPYLLMARRTLMLRRKVNELQMTTHGLRLELDAILAKLSARKTEAQAMKVTLGDVVMGTNAVQHRTADLITENNASRRDLDMLLGESQQLRAQRAALKALGSSLADVAAFMHEMELQIGIQPLSSDAQRRVDRLRIAALRLQDLGVFRQPDRQGATHVSEESSGAKPAGEENTR